jgi:hypothetical protein
MMQKILKKGKKKSDQAGSDHPVNENVLLLRCHKTFSSNGFSHCSPVIHHHSI